MNATMILDGANSITEVTEVIETRVNHLSASRIARAYITNLFVRQIHAPVDFSQESVVLAYIEAKRDSRILDLAASQQIGDWVLWVASLYPAHLRAHQSVAETFARLSYLRCYRLVPSWQVYDELAEGLPSFTRALSAQFMRTSMIPAERL